MSWFKSNYHWVALGGGVLALGVLGYVGHAANKSLNDEFAGISKSPKTDAGAKGGELADSLNQTLVSKEQVSLRKTPNGRPVKFFTSVDWFIKDGDKSQPYDLLQDPKELHEGIPNQWWVDNGVDPSFDDSPERDHDADGFTNREEYDGGSDPVDPKSFGDLLKKLEVVSVERDTWILKFESSTRAGFQFSYRFFKDSKSNRGKKVKTPVGQGVVVQDKFFKQKNGKERFQLIGSEERPSPRGSLRETWAKVRDLKEGKRGEVFELRKGGPRRGSPKGSDFRYDHRVTFRLNAIGQTSKEVTIDEDGVFTLPFDGGPKKYRLLKVELNEKKKPETVIVQEVTEDPTIKPWSIKVPLPPLKQPN